MADAKKIYRLAEVKQLAEDRSKCIMVINNRVYDVTKFIDEHPGGEEVLKEQHGADASNAFEDVGHSTDAREQMKGYEIGEIHPDDIKTKVKPRPLIVNPSNSSENAAGSWVRFVIPLVIVIVAIIYFRLFSKPTVDTNNPPKAI
ncbi:unnamed protein product [Adineta ricciae]|uniref:Cytochrome b5 n=1 Tax=Adineta ricciae TaxID=249248 RepID=A0A815R4V8_ADIRI|nr:unnamed protein product [Adineta ricciae]CAF1472192.1 unnamed protein product [Adineta ricciae]